MTQWSMYYRPLLLLISMDHPFFNLAWSLSPPPEYPAACRGMNDEVNRAEAHQSEGGLAMAQFRLIPHRLRRGASLGE